MSPYATGENTLAKDVLGALDGGMLCLADRGFFGYQMWVTGNQPALLPHLPRPYRSERRGLAANSGFHSRGVS